MEVEGSSDADEKRRERLRVLEHPQLLLRSSESAPDHVRVSVVDCAHDLGFRKPTVDDGRRMVPDDRDARQQGSDTRPESSESLFCRSEEEMP
jgi:hypothetical protein